MKIIFTIMSLVFALGCTVDNQKVQRDKVIDQFEGKTKDFEREIDELKRQSKTGSEEIKKRN